MKKPYLRNGEYRLLLLREIHKKAKKMFSISNLELPNNKCYK